MEVKVKNKDIISSSLKFVEQDIDDKNYYYETLICPFKAISRNGFMYNKESLVETKDMVIGKPLLWNHKTNGDWDESKPRGEWVETWISEEGLHGKACIYDVSYNTELIEWLSAAKNTYVSLNVSGKGVKKRDEKGRLYTEAYIQDWKETSFVAVPGFVQASGSFIMEMCESFDEQEEYSTLNEINDLLNKYN